MLGLIGREHPGARLCGIDISPEQIATARRHLEGLGLGEAELVVGDAAALPWPDRCFDRVRLVWVVEHLANPEAVLREARRVLKPAGTIHLTETDYGSLRVSPPDAAIEAFLAAFIAHFNRHGDAHAGPRLGPLLERCGFEAVDVRITGIHLWSPGRREELRRFGAYLLGFLTPELPALLAAADCAETAAMIKAGHRGFADLPERQEAALSVCVYQARGLAGG